MKKPYKTYMCNICGKYITEEEGVNYAEINGRISWLCDDCTEKYLAENDNNCKR